ncbi:uncharacterized protein [Asterias amurensis]|uniref:uncharacterized protein isoform X2 n=1 Tax=Asterias amurensis TaxID=7602 RepID=UPI003AB7FFEC
MKECSRKLTSFAKRGEAHLSLEAMQESPITSNLKGNRQLRKSVRLSTKLSKSSKKPKTECEGDADVSVSDEPGTKVTDQPDGSVPNRALAEANVCSKKRKKRMHSKSSSIKKKRSKHSTEDEDEQSDWREESPLRTRKNMSEERRALHRVHERQRHQSLNDAIQELVKVLPPGDVYRNVTKFNVLRKANDYIDFLQSKINKLCLAESIEQKREDCWLSFNVPLKATIDGKELKVPASTPISPKLLCDIKRSAKIVSVNQQADKFAWRPDKVRTPQTPLPRYSGLRSKKIPHEKPNPFVTQNTPAYGFYKDVPYKCFSKIPEKLPQKVPHTDLGDHSSDVPYMDPGSYSKMAPHNNPGGYSKKVFHTDLGGHPEHVSHMEPGIYSKNVCNKNSGVSSKRVSRRDLGSYSEKVPLMDLGIHSVDVPPMDPEGYSKKVEHKNPRSSSEEVSHTDPGDYCEDVPHTISGSYSEKVPHNNPGGYSKMVPNTNLGYSVKVPHKDPGGFSREVSHMDLSPPTPQNEDVFESDQGELVVDEEQMPPRKSDVVEIDNLCTFKQIPKESSVSLPIVSRMSSQRRKMKNPCQRKVASLGHAPSTSLDREQRKRLLDYYISGDSSPDSAYSAPANMFRPGWLSPSSANAKSGSNVESEGETSFQTPSSNHLEHSYSADSRQSYPNSEARLPSELSSVSDNVNQPVESSQDNSPEIMASQVKTHSTGPGYLCASDRFVSYCQIDQDHKSNATSTARPTKETTLVKNGDLGCSRVLQTKELTQPMIATPVPLLYSNINDSTNPSAKSTSLMGTASNDTATTTPCRSLTSSSSLPPAEASFLPSSNMMTTTTSGIVPNLYSSATATALVNQSTTTGATFPSQIIKMSKSSENKVLHYSIILPTSIVNPSTVPTLQPTLTKQPILSRKTESLQSFTFMPSTLAQYSQAATTPKTPTSCETALLQYSTVYPAAPVHQSAKPAKLPIRNNWTSQTSSSGSHRYLTFVPTTQMPKNKSATNLPSTSFRTSVVPEQPTVLPDAVVRHCGVPNKNAALLSSAKTLHYSTVLPNTQIYYTTATSKVITTQHLRTTTASVAPLLFSNTVVCQSTAASTVPVQKMLMTSRENTLLQSPTVFSSLMTQRDSEKLTFMPTSHQQVASTSTLPVPCSVDKTSASHCAAPVLSKVTTSTMATATAMTTNTTPVSRTLPQILPNTILHHTTVPTTQPLETAQIMTACETAKNYVTATTSSQTTVSPTSTTSEQTTPQGFVPIQPATTESTDTAPTAPAFQQVTIYEAAVDVIPQNNQATVAIAQTLVVDASCLQFEESESPLEIPSGSESPTLTPTAASGCSLRRSWINGYQLFTKVNHPKFREKWPELQGRDITKLLGQVWKELPGDSKKHYSRRACEWNQWHRRKREPKNKRGKEE